MEEHEAEHGPEQLVASVDNHLRYQDVVQFRGDHSGQGDRQHSNQEGCDIGHSQRSDHILEQILHCEAAKGKRLVETVRLGADLLLFRSIHPHFPARDRIAVYIHAGRIVKHCNDRSTLLKSSDQRPHGIHMPSALQLDFAVHDVRGRKQVIQFLLKRLQPGRDLPVRNTVILQQYFQRIFDIGTFREMIGRSAAGHDQLQLLK